MKKFILTLLFVVAVSMSANAQSLLREDFNYTAGDSIGAHGWVVFSGAGTNPLMVTAPGLVFPGYGLSNIGNATTFTRSGSDYYKAFSSNDSLGATYCAMMVRIDTASTTGDYFTAFLPSNSTSNYACRIFAKDSLGFVSFGLSKGATTTIPAVYSAPIYVKGVTYVIVMKYKWNSGTGDDEVSAIIFNTPIIPATEPAPTLGPVSAGTDSPNLGRIAFRQSTVALSAAGRLDGVLAFNVWNDLVTEVKTVSTVADKFTLSQNYPNPFNPSTTINFSLPTNGKASLKVYDIMGKEVSSLVNGNMNAGVYSAQFNGVNLSSGMYFYNLEFTGANGQFFSEQKRLMLVK